jgi:hypothetical protein
MFTSFLLQFTWNLDIVPVNYLTFSNQMSFITSVDNMATLFNACTKEQCVVI